VEGSSSITVPSSASALLLTEARQRTGVHIAAYCLMANQWRLLLWPRTGRELSEIMRWITSAFPTLRTRHQHAAEEESGVEAIKGSDKLDSGLLRDVIHIRQLITKIQIHR
jgi:hypothetical protein